MKMFGKLGLFAGGQADRPAAGSPKVPAALPQPQKPLLLK